MADPTDSDAPQEPRARRRGRRPAGENTRETILTAARRLFLAEGYDRVSMRAIAREAGVDPALVHHYFDGKPDLFMASVIAGGVSPVRELARIADADASELGGRVANAFLNVWDSPQAQGAFASVLQMATSPDEGASPIREFVVAEILARVPKQCDDPVEADRRAQMMASQLLGIAVARYVLKLPMIAEATQQQLVDWAGPSLQCCLEGCDIPIAGSGRPALLDGESSA